MSKWKPLDYFFATRPVLYIPGWSTLLAGYAGAIGISDYRELIDWQLYPNRQIVLLLMLFAAAMGGCFLLNQLQDRQTDRVNNKLFIISKGVISQWEAIGLTIVTLVISLFLSGLVNGKVFLANLLFLFITGYVYNYPPFVAKDRPIGSLLANVLMGGIAYALGWLAVRDGSWQLLADMAPYLLFNSALYFFTLIPDRSGDAAVEKNTLAVTLSLKQLIYWSMAIYLTGFVTAIYLNDFRAILIFLPTLPFFLNSLIKKSEAAAVKTTKFGIFFFAMVICLKFNWYFLLLLFIFLLTKWYFKQRFNFNYPNFGA